MNKLSARTHGVHDESFRRRSQVVERVTGNQRQGRFRGVGQDARVVRSDHFARFHAVLIGSAERGEQNHVAGLDASQAAEERIAVPGESDISQVSGKRGAWNVSYRDRQCPLRDTFQNHGFQPNARNFDSSDD